jgi:predicted amidohydrolase
MAKIALAQFDSAICDVSANTVKMERMIGEAASEKADIIAFPELFSTGYNLEIIKEDIWDMADDGNGECLTAARAAAKRGGIYVIAPVAFKQDGKFYNSAAVIDDNGNILNTYHKNNLWDLEKKYFEYGNHDYKVFEAPFGSFGVIICYDVDFPETSRRLALRGADIIFVCSAWAVTHRNLWDIFLPARALENTIFVAGINRTGKEGDAVYFGDSKVFDPTGKLLKKAGGHVEGILCCETDFSTIGEIRKDFPYLQELRRDYP